jgi:hypothetical protein
MALATYVSTKSAPAFMVKGDIGPVFGEKCRSGPARYLPEWPAQRRLLARRA